MSKSYWAAIPASQYPFLMGLKSTKHRNKGEKIYKDDDKGKYYHKDRLHGELEEYDKFGNHVGVLTPEGWPHPHKGMDRTKTIKGII